MSEEQRNERLDRELMELLNELRVALPGVQVLFAFLLTLPFTQRFVSLDDNQRSVYFGAFLATALSSILLMAPTAYHRLRFREHDKERLIEAGNRFAISGLVMLSVAIALVVFLIGDFVYGSPLSGVVAAVAVVALAWFWFGLPLTRGQQDDDR